MWIVIVSLEYKVAGFVSLFDPTFSAVKLSGNGRSHVHPFFTTERKAENSWLVES